MKRILVAIFVLCATVTISFISIKCIETKLNIMEEKTIVIMSKAKPSKDLDAFWKDSEKMFAIILNEEKYKTLSRYIYLTAYKNGDDLVNLCHEIIFEINVIRKTQEISFENIL